MAVTTTKTNKPLNPRGNDQSPKGYNRAALYSGKALDFDGVNDEIDLDGFTMSGNTASFAFYLKANEWNANDFIFDSRPTRLTIGGDGTNANQLQIRSGDIWVKLADISDTTNTNHFVITIDGTTAKLFLNGEPFGVTAILSSEIDLSSNANTALMSFSAGSGAFFNGQLSGFKIFNTALTPAQVSDLYNNPEKIVPTGVEDTALKLWLPMMEGAGTTAYDGSGNGNHGTISGATWTHGVGSPVAQSAVIDWNKGTNLVPDVNNFNSAFEITTTTGLANDPAGRSNAVRFTKTTDTTPRYGFQTCGSATLLGNTNYVISLFYKYDGHAFTSSIEYNNSGHFDLSWVCNLNISASGVTIAGVSNCTASVQEYSNGWYRVIVQLTTGASPSGIPQYLVKMQGNTGTSLLVAYAQLEQASSVGPLVPTFGTAQTSPVLLPQGLTSGRDITGVNLFENVRKQGALNLDGNSWAEVHDNASVDLTTAISMECWAYIDDLVSTRVFFAKWAADAAQRAYVLYQSGDDLALTLSDGSNYGTSSLNVLTTGWHHIVATYVQNGNMTYYVDGSQTDAFAFTRAIRTTTAEIEIGRNEGPTGANYFKNQIAQPRIYNRALTAEEVERNYNAGKNIYK